MINNRRYENFTEWNDEMIKKFDLEHYHQNSNPIISFIESLRIKYILKFLQTNEHDKIIEIGCGPGDVLGKINKGERIGLDISQYILNIARQRYVNIEFVVGNAESLSEEIKKNQYDKIICSEVLEHLENPQKALEEIIKIIKRDGIVVSSFPNEKLVNKIKGWLQKLKIFSLIFPKISQKMDDEWHLHGFDLDLFKKILPEELKIKKIAKVPFFFLPLRYVVKLRLT